MGWETKETVFVDDVLLIATTAKAYLIRSLDDAEVWIPKSQVADIQFGDNIKDDKTGNMIKEIRHLELPKWLAEKHNLY